LWRARRGETVRQPAIQKARVGRPTAARESVITRYVYRRRFLQHAERQRTIWSVQHSELNSTHRLLPSVCGVGVCVCVCVCGGVWQCACGSVRVCGGSACAVGGGGGGWGVWCVCVWGWACVGKACLGTTSPPAPPLKTHLFSLPPTPCPLSAATTP